MAQCRVSIVVLTHNRINELMRCLQQLTRLPEAPPLVVVDNASRDGTGERVASRFPQVRLLRRPRNEGAAGRNAGVACVQTPYVAFCDDDTWWAPGALSRAAALLDAHPRLAALSARVLVGTSNRLDPTCERMAASPLPSRGLPGPALVGFMAGAAVMRTAAFREVGGYEPRLLIGAEEALMSLDLLERGWQIAYAPQLVTHHHPSPARDAAARRWLLARNRLWLAGLRLPVALAWRECRTVLQEAARQRLAWRALVAALRGLPWVLAHRRPVAIELARLWQQVQHRSGAGVRALPISSYPGPADAPEEPT
jgi:GT2 family glycosyltransferase